MAFIVILNSGISLLVRQLRVGHYVIALLNSIFTIRIKVSIKDGFVMLKVKNKHVVQTEALTKPNKLIYHFGTNLPSQFRSQGGRNGEEQKEQCSPRD